MYTTALPNSVCAIQTVQTVQSIAEEWFVLETNEINKQRVMARRLVMVRTGTKQTVMSGPSSCLAVSPLLQSCCQNRFYYCVVQLSSSQSCCLSGLASSSPLHAGFQPPQ